MPFEKTFKRLDPDKLEVIRRKLQEEYDARDSADFFGFKEVRRARKTLAIGARETYTLSLSLSLSLLFLSLSVISLSLSLSSLSLYQKYIIVST